MPILALEAFFVKKKTTMEQNITPSEYNNNNNNKRIYSFEMYRIHVVCSLLQNRIYERKGLGHRGIDPVPLGDCPYLVVSAMF